VTKSNANIRIWSFRCSCINRCLATDLGKKWIRVRTVVLSVVDTPAFEWMILILIFASSITLCFEDIYLDDNPFLKKILYWTNLGFCTLFSVEMLLKWLALGFCKYFTSFWTILDFIIVFVSMTNDRSVTIAKIKPQRLCERALCLFVAWIAFPCLSSPGITYLCRIAMPSNFTYNFCDSYYWRANRETFMPFTWRKNQQLSESSSTMKIVTITL